MEGMDSRLSRMDETEIVYDNLNKMTTLIEQRVNTMIDDKVQAC